MNEEILREIRFLKETLNTVQHRLAQLESRVSSPKPAAPFPKAPLPQTGFKTVPPLAAQPKRDMESTIGRYWLNRIGVSSLVLGLAFFILYSFQYVGPLAKLGIGFVTGFALLGTGIWMEKRHTFAWYARGLLGGGWAVIYFTTYAMHHIPAVQVIQSPWVDLILLAGVSAGAVAHSLKYRSQTVTALAFLLGFITASVGQISYFTLWASVFLSAALVVLVIRMQWHELAFYGVVVTYLTHTLWVVRQIGLSRIFAVHVATVAEARFWLSIGFIVLYWLTYTAAALGLKETGASRARLLTISLVNGLAFVYLAILEVSGVFPARHYLACAGVGVLSLLASGAARWRGSAAVANVNFLLGLGLLTVAIPLKLSGRWTTFLWLTEAIILNWTGLRYQRFRYRVFALVVSAVTWAKILTVDLWDSRVIPIASGWISWRLSIGLYAIATLAIAATLHRLPSLQTARRPVERHWHYLYLAAAALLGLVLAAAEPGSREWVLGIWALEGFVLTALGLRLKDRGIRIMGVVCFGLAWLLIPSEFNSAEKLLPAAVSLYAAAALYRRLLPGKTSGWEERCPVLYILAASALITRVLVLTVLGRWVSVVVAVEGLLFLAAGFLLSERALRWSALAVFAFLMSRILLVDLAGVETIYRILSFIVAGGILLLASLGYARFETLLSKEKAGYKITG